MVRAFHNQGACVCFCDVDVPAAKRLVREFDGQIEFFKVDLRKEGEINQWISQVASRFKRIDALINNAAADPRIRLEDTTTKAWDDLVARNLRAFFLTSREASKWMTPGCSIINFSSITLHTGPTPMTSYVSTKAGMLDFT